MASTSAPGRSTFHLAPNLSSATRLRSTTIGSRITRGKSDFSCMISQHHLSTFHKSFPMLPHSIPLDRNLLIFLIWRSVILLLYGYFPSPSNMSSVTHKLLQWKFSTRIFCFLPREVSLTPNCSQHSPKIDSPPAHNTLCSPQERKMTGEEEEELQQLQQ